MCVFHPNGNGGDEGDNHTIGHMLLLGAYEQQTTWDDQLPCEIFAYTSMSAATGVAPTDAHIGLLT